MVSIDFDITEVEEKTEYALLPEGRYRCIVSSSDIKENNAGTGDNLNLKIEIVSGEYAGRLVFENLCWRHESDKAVQIARARFAELCRAVGILAPADTEQLHDIPFDCIIGIQKGSKGYSDSNKVKKYFPRSEGQAAEKIEKKQAEDDLPF